MLICGLVKSSLIDYPSNIAAVIFTAGCNFRCPYCHNPDVVLANTPYLDEKQVLEFLYSRVNKLDGVVISGGEPTLQKDLRTFVCKIKSAGFKIKLDTNGSHPVVLEKLIAENLLDYVAMDIKAPLEKYRQITNSDINFETIAKSMKILKNSGIDFEYRTTILNGMPCRHDFYKIKEMFEKWGYPGRYYLQKFVPSRTLDKNFQNQCPPDDDEIAKIVAIFDNAPCKCFVR